MLISWPRREKIEEERDKKTAVSLIRELVIGDVSVSQLRMERDKARVMYRSVDEAINIKKVRVTYCRITDWTGMAWLKENSITKKKRRLRAKNCFILGEHHN